jgi:hypothetical protein
MLQFLLIHREIVSYFFKKFTFSYQHLFLRNASLSKKEAFGSDSVLLEKTFLFKQGGAVRKILWRVQHIFLHQEKYNCAHNKTIKIWRRDHEEK